MTTISMNGLPKFGLDSNGKRRALLVTPEGELVTDLSPLPTETKNVHEVSLRVDDQGNLKIAGE